MQAINALSFKKQLVCLWLAGAFSTLALAPFFIVPVLWLTVSLLIYILKNISSGKQTFLCGWAFGFGYFSVGLYWFAHALLIDAVSFGWLIPLALIGIGGGLGLYIAIAARCAYRWRHLPYGAYSVVFSLCWVFAEIARSYLFSGFPWNLIGYSWAAHEVSIQASSLGGIWLLSLLTMLFASTPLWFMEKAKPRFLLVAIMGVVGGMLYYGYERLQHNPTEYESDVGLRLVQASIKQELKWAPEERVKAIEKYLEMSRFNLPEHITHIIWPESAMTQRFEAGEFWTHELAKFSPNKGALITGVVRLERPIEGKPLSIYNSLKSVTSDGTIEAVYDKRKLVPFGEYIPFRNILPLEKITHGALDFTAGNSSNPITIKGAPPARPLICYEAIFPHLSEAAHPAWLLNITNDGWFGNSTGPYQHFHMSRMRAVEQGVPLVRAANNGISAVIDPYGRIVASLGLNEVGVVDSKLPKAKKTMTFYALYGVLPLLCSVVILIFYIAFVGRIEKRAMS